MKLSDALREAQGRGLDLVEVAPTAAPPVCKIVALGKFRYDISKQEKDKKPSGTKLKEIKFRVNIDEHDYLTKIRHGEEFLERGNKVRVQLHPLAGCAARDRLFGRCRSKRPAAVLLRSRLEMTRADLK